MLITVGLGSPGFPSQKREVLLSRRFRLYLMACLAVMTILTSATQSAQTQQPAGELVSPSNTSRASEANTQAALHEPQIKSQSSAPQNLNTASDERKRQLADESACLLQLANGLKAEVNKTNKDTLSLTVIQKANEIERLAHRVKEGSKALSGAK